MAEQRASDLVVAAPVLARAGDTDVVIELVPGATLSVYVRDEQGRPVVAEVTRAAVDDPGTPGTVWFNMTNEKGLAVWTGVSPGLVRTLARVEGGAVGGAGPTRVTPGEDVRADITVRAGGRLRIHAAENTKSYGVILGGMLVDFAPLEPGGIVTTKGAPRGDRDGPVARRRWLGHVERGHSAPGRDGRGRARVIDRWDERYERNWQARPPGSG